MPLDSTVPDDLVPIGGNPTPAPASTNAAPPQQQSSLPSDIMPIPKDIVPVGPTPEPPPTDAGLLMAPIAGALRGTAEVGQSAGLLTGDKPQPLPEENTIAAQPVSMADLWHPKNLAEKSLYQIGKSFPTLTAGAAGAVAGEALGGPPGALAGGAFAAGAATMVQSLGPEFARALKENPNNPDAAFNTAAQRAAASGVISGVGWRLFDLAPFSGAVKNMLFQAFGVQPAVTAAGRATENVIEGRPAGEGVAEELPGAVIGTAIPMAGHAAAHAIARRFLPSAAPGPAGPGQGGQGGGPAGGAPGGGAAVPPDTMPLPGSTVDIAGVDQPMTVKGYRGDLVDLETSDGKPHMMTQADFSRLHTVTAPAPTEIAQQQPAALPAPDVIYGPGRPWQSTGEGMIPGVPGFTMAREGATTNQQPAEPARSPVTLDDIDRWAMEEHHAQAAGENPTPASQVTSPIEQAVEAATKPATDLLALPPPRRALPKPTTIYGEGFTAQPPVPLDAMGILKARMAASAPSEQSVGAPLAQPGETSAQSLAPAAQPGASLAHPGTAEVTTPKPRPAAPPPIEPQAPPPQNEDLSVAFNEGYGFAGSREDALRQSQHYQDNRAGTNFLAGWIARQEGMAAAPASAAPIEVPTASHEPGITVKQAPEVNPPTENESRIIEGQHTKTKAPIVTVQLPQRVGSDEFKALGVKARELGGYYSAYRGNGAKPGFIFKTRDAAEKFAALARGEAPPAAQPPPTTVRTAPTLPPEHPGLVIHEPRTGRTTLLNPKQDWTEIGKNQTGQTVYEDHNGVRSYIENGIRHTESVGMKPGPGGLQPIVTPPGEKDLEYQVSEPSETPAQKIGRDLVRAREETETAPTEGQIEAGNYKKGRVDFHGLDFVMENPVGYTRRGVGSDGEPWEVTLPADYGYLSKTEGADGEHVDAFINPDPTNSTTAYIIDQVDADTGAFDEHKVMLGYDSWREARNAYESAFSDNRGADRLGNVTPMSLDELKAWLKEGDLKSPVYQHALPLPEPAPKPATTTTEPRTAAEPPQPEKPTARPEFEPSRDMSSGEEIDKSLAQPTEAPTSTEAAAPPPETEGGIQNALPPRDEGTGTGPLHVPAPERPVGQPPGTEEPGGTRAPVETAGEAQEPEFGGAEISGGTGAGDADRISAGETGAGRPVPGTPVRPPNPPGTSRPAAEPEPDAQVKGTNFHIEPGAIAEGRTPRAKANANVAAIELANRLVAEARPATKEEQLALAQYVGWGGLSGAFPDLTTGAFRKGFEDIGKRLKDILTPDEYRTAQRSTQYAHYTSEPVIRSMWDAVRRMGFDGGMVFEPGMGIGHFLGMMPGDLAERSKYQGVEMDGVTAKIAKLLYPESGVRQGDFTRMPVPDDTFDLAIGNPPFGDIAIKADPRYAARNFLLHDFFFAKSLDAVRPGGLLGFITSAGTMNKLDDTARRYLAERAEFAGGIRLPSSAFARNAGTEVTTDILFFKKHPFGRKDLGDEPPSWMQTVQRELPGPGGTAISGNVSRYFSENPERVLGQEGFFSKLHRGQYGVQPREGQDLEADIRQAVSTLPENIMGPPPSPEEKAALDFKSTESKDGSFYVAPDGRLMQYAMGAGRPVQRIGKGVEGGYSTAEMERIRQLLPIRDALRQVFLHDLAANAEEGDKARAELNRVYDQFVALNGPINKAEYTYRRPTIVQAESARAEAREDAREAGKEWDEGDFDREFPEGTTVSTMARARQDARDAAAAAGREFREGTFDPSDMPDIVIVKRPNIDPFMDDQESYRLRALEDYNDNTGEAAKRRVFFENTITRETEPEIRSAQDGIMWSINKFGRLDLDQIADKIGTNRDDVINQLGQNIMRVPGTEDTYQVRDEYLSGDVVTKLEEATAAAERDPYYRRNVAALREAQPAPLTPSEVIITLGMSWLPPKTVQDFADHLDLGNIDVSYTPQVGKWRARGDRWSRGAGTAEWATNDMGAHEILQNALNRIPARITRTNKGPPQRTWVDEDATQAAQDKIDRMKEAFSDWVLSDPQRLDNLVGLYNDKFNRVVLRKWDGDYLTTPGVSNDWSWRPHQKGVIARIIQSGNTYMDHAVGAGKTSAMIGSGMEMRRLGLVRKPMYVVPNHMLGQFAKEFYEQYPTARIRVADDRNFHTSRRKQFVADVAQQDLDAIIITNSAFGKIPISEEFGAQLIQEEIDKFAEAIQALGGVDSKGRPRDSENRITVKDLQKRKEKLEQRLSKGTGDKDVTNTFEELGVDFLFTDEAHQFRKLSFVTQTPMKGITSQGSNMAWDLYTKIRYLDQNRPGRSVVLASGTPITNTMGELYTVSRYLQPQALAERGLSHFDSWAQAFGDTKTGLEQTAQGTYEPVTRFAKFVNVPELYRMVAQVMDIVTSEQLGQYVTRPTLAGGQRQLHLTPRTPLLEGIQQDLARRVELIKKRKGPPSKGDDIILAVINDGRLAAIDPRMADPSFENEPTSKLNEMIDNVHRIWGETHDQPFYEPGTDNEIMRGPATQLVFSNLGISGADGRFSGYDWMRREWGRRGIPASQIAFIKDYARPVDKQRLFNDINAGKVRILVGSTQKMGTGVNVQRRLIAIHNLDPLWYPADDEQRNGRGIRQGNLNKEIAIHDYATRGTYDATMYDMMGRKGRFIEAFFRGDPDLREMEDLGEASTYEQAAAISTSDPRVIELTAMKQALEKMQRRQRAHEGAQYTARRNVQHYTESAAYRARKAENYATTRTAIEASDGRLLVGGKAYDKPGDIAKAIDDVVKREYPNLVPRGDPVQIGTVAGFPLLMSDEGAWSNQGRQVEKRLTPTFSVLFWGKSGEPGEHIMGASVGAGVVQASRKLLESIPGREATERADAAEATKQANAYADQVGKAFEDADKIAPLREAVAKLETELATTGEEQKPASTATLAEERAPAGWGEAGAGPTIVQQLRGMAPSLPKATPMIAEILDHWRDSGISDPTAAVADWVGKRGSETGHEYYGAVSPAKGIVDAGTSHLEQLIRFSDRLVAHLMRPGDDVIDLHHNHPSANSLSTPDLMVLAAPNARWVVAHTSDGHVSAARLTPQAAEWLHGMPHNDAADIIAKLSLMASESADNMITKIAKLGMPRQKLDLLYREGVNRALAAAGLIDYMGTRPLQGWMRSPIERGAQTIAGELPWQPSEENIDDRFRGSAGQVLGHNLAMERFSQPDAEGAAGRSAGEGSGTRSTTGAGEPRAAVYRAAGLAEEGTKDFSDRATEEAIDQAMGPTGAEPPGNWFSRLQDDLGAKPGTPAGDHKDFAVTQKMWTLPSTKGSTDPLSNPKWLAELAKKRDAAAFLDQYKQGLASWRGKPMEQWRKVFSALELLTLDGAQVPTDGRSIIVENRDRPLAALSKPGEIIRIEQPDEIQMLGDYLRTMDRVWQNLVGETARQFGWTGTPTSAAINAAAAKAQTPGLAKSLQRAARIVAAIEYQHRNSYLPLMRRGDYFIRVTPRAGTADKPGIPGWTGDGYPPTTLFKLIDSRTPLERAVGGMRSGTPKTAQAEIDALRQQFPEDEYDIDHGYMFAKTDALRDMDIPAIDKLMMLVGNDARGQIADRLRHTGMGADEARSVAQDDYDRLVDSVLDRIYEERVAGFKRPRSGVPGYDPDFGRATSDYLHWLASYTSDLRHRPALERADAIIAQHPDPRTRAFWRDFDRRQEDYGDELHGPLMHIRQGAFYWLLGMNAASTAKIALHGPLLGLPTMTTGLGALGGARAAGDYLAAAGSILKGMRIGPNGIEADITKAARTPEERALIADSEAKGITHPQTADELSAMRGRGEVAMTPQQSLMRRALDIWGSNISAADRMIRASMLLAAHRTATRLGMDAINRVWDRDLNWKNAPMKTAAAWAQFMVDRTAGIWGDINRLPLLRSQLGGMMGQFRTYEINYLSTMWQLMSRMGPAGKVSAAMMLGGMGMLGGAVALPFFQDAEAAANWLYKTIMGIDPDLEGSLKSAMDAMVPGVGEDILHGAVRPLLGTDIGSIGFGDIASRNMESPLDLFGAGISMPLTALSRANERYQTGQEPLAVARELMPSAVKNLIGGMYPETALASAPHGTIAMAPSQLSTADQVKMGLGFRPAATTQHYEQVQQQMHRVSAFKAALATDEDRVSNLMARGINPKDAIIDLEHRIAQGEREGVLPANEMAEVKGALRARILQRIHPEIPSKSLQRYQAAHAQP